MPSEVEMSGFVTARMNARTVEDLRTLVGWLNKYSVPNSTEIDFDRGTIYVELTGENAVPAEWIECGNHVPPVSRYDILIDTHKHDDDLKEAYKQMPDTYEEALERGYDRYADERRPE